MKINRVFTKPVIYILLIILGASTNRAFAFFKESSDSFRYEGYIKSANDNVAGVNINVYIDNNKVAITTSSRQGGFHLYLQHNKTYIIEFVKKDYITEKIQLETKISDEELKKGGIELSTDNEIEIFEYFTGMKINIFDNPVLYYYFNTKTFLIEEDLKKSKTAQLNTIRSSVTTSKNKLATAELKNAEALFKKQKYEEALVSYSLVLEYSPDNQTALDKLKEVKKILKKVPDFENNYKAIVQKADGFFNSKNYSDAKDNYKKAKAMKPDDPYPANKLYILDSIVTKNYVLNKKEYEKLIISADQEYKDKKYEDAQKGYESALALQVDIKYPQKQINAIKIAVAAEKKKKDDDAKAIEEKYKSLIKKGDDYMSKNDFANASAIYKQALELKPEDSYANSQKGKADKSLTEAAIEKLKTQKDKNYYDTIALGDKALKSKDNNLALTMYSAALGIKPSEKYPAKKIKEINRLLVSTINETEKQVANKPIMKPNEKQKAEKLDSGKVTGTYIKELQSEAENQEKSGNIEAASKTNMNIADFFREKDQFGKALYFLNKTFSLLKKKGDKAGESKVLNDIATVFYDSGQYKQTVSAYKEALALKKELGDVKGQAEVLSEMGNVLENTYQYETATDALNEVLVIRQQMGDNEGVSEVCNKLGGIYYSQNDYNKSILFFNKSLTIAESSNNKDSKGSLLNSLGVVYYKMGKFEEAIKFYNKSISVDKESGNNKNMSLSFNNIGNINFDWSKYEKAIEYYQRSLVLKRQLNFEQGMAVSMFNIGNSYLELKNFLKANEFLSSGLELAKKINFREVMQLSYKALSKLYENTGNFRSAMYASNSLIAILAEELLKARFLK